MNRIGIFVSNLFARQQPAPAGQTTNVPRALQEIVVEDDPEDETRVERGGSGRTTGTHILFDSEEEQSAVYDPTFGVPGVASTPRPKKERIDHSDDSWSIQTQAWQKHASTGRSSDTGSRTDSHSSSTSSLSGVFETPEHTIVEISDEDDSQQEPLPSLQGMGTTAGASAAATGSQPTKNNPHGITLGDERDLYARILTRISEARIRRVKEEHRQLKQRERERVQSNAPLDIETGMPSLSSAPETFETIADAFLQKQKIEVQQQFEKGISDDQILWIDFMKSLRSEETIELQDRCNKSIAELKKYYEDYPVMKQIGIFFSGWAANWICFGTGNIFNALTGVFGLSPYWTLLTPLISGTTWQFGQPQVDNIRPTTARSRILTIYQESALWRGRQWRDHIYKSYGRDVEKYYFEPVDPDTGIPEPRFMSAEEIYHTYQERKAFLAKFPTDEITYNPYIVMGAAAGLIFGVWGLTLFGPLSVGANAAVQVGGRLLSGGIAGGLTALGMQNLREYFIKKGWYGYKDCDILFTKQREHWAQEAAYLEPFIRDAVAYRDAHPELDKDTLFKLDTSIKQMEFDLERAKGKSHFFSSIGVEWKLSWGKKRVTADRDPDAALAGERLDTAASYLGKITCLTPVAIANIATAGMRSKEASLLDQAIGTLIVNFVLIYPGFCFRLEWAWVWRLLLSGIKADRRGWEHLSKVMADHVESETRNAEINAQVIAAAKAMAAYDTSSDDSGASVQTGNAFQADPTAAAHNRPGPYVHFGEDELAESLAYIEKNFPHPANQDDGSTGSARATEKPDKEERRFVRALDKANRELAELHQDDSLDEQEKAHRVRGLIAKLSRHGNQPAMRVPNAEQDSSDPRIRPPNRQEDSSDIYIDITQETGRSSSRPLTLQEMLSQEESVSTS